MAKKSPRDAVQFTRESAERIAGVVRSAELGSPAAAPLKFNRPSVASSQKAFRVCTFTGTWTKNSAKTVTFRGVTATPNTAVAQNIFVTVSNTATSTRNCAIAKDGTAWYLISAEC